MAALPGRLLPAIQLRPICSPRPQLDAPGPRPQRRARRVDSMGEMCAGFHAVPETSCSPSWATAASTCLLTAATSACASSNWVARCHWGRSFRFFEKPSIYLRTSNIVRSVPPSLMRMGRVSFLDRYECAIDCSPYHRLCSLERHWQWKQLHHLCESHAVCASSKPSSSSSAECGNKNAQAIRPADAKLMNFWVSNCLSQFSRS